MIIWHAARHHGPDRRDDLAQHKVFADAQCAQRCPGLPCRDVDLFLEVQRTTSPRPPRPERQVGAVGHVEAAEAGAALEEELDALAVQAAQLVRAEGREAGQPLREEAEGLVARQRGAPSDAHVVEGGGAPLEQLGKACG
eukprot:scaffold57514_cov55-Phaeocystis_antarctica.AAC.5